jgi:hypothetical protein
MVDRPADAGAKRTNRDATVGVAVGSATVGIGAAMTATLAGVCCTGPLVAPIVVGILGAAGAAAAASLKPYTFLLFSASFVLIAIGFSSVSRARRSCAVEGSSRSLPVTVIVTQAVLWFSAAIWVASVAFTIYAVASS